MKETVSIFGLETFFYNKSLKEFRWVVKLLMSVSSLFLFVVVGAGFITYLEPFKPYLVQALRERGEYQVR